MYITRFTYLAHEFDNNYKEGLWTNYLHHIPIIAELLVGNCAYQGDKKEIIEFLTKFFASGEHENAMQVCRELANRDIVGVLVQLGPKLPM